MDQVSPTPNTNNAATPTAVAPATSATNTSTTVAPPTEATNPSTAAPQEPTVYAPTTRVINTKKIIGRLKSEIAANGGDIIAPGETMKSVAIPSNIRNSFGATSNDYSNFLSAVNMGQWENILYEKQSMGAKASNMVTGLALQSIAGLLDGAGNIIEMFERPDSIWNGHTGESNFLYDSAASLMDYSQEFNTIFQDPNGGIWNSAYWMQQGQSLGYTIGLLGWTALETAALTAATGGVYAASGAGALRVVNNIRRFANVAKGATGAVGRAIFSRATMMGVLNGINETRLNTKESFGVVVDTLNEKKNAGELDISVNDIYKKAEETAKRDNRMEMLPNVLVGAVVFNVANVFGAIKAAKGVKAGVAPSSLSGISTGIGQTTGTISDVIGMGADALTAGIKNKALRTGVRYVATGGTEFAEEYIQTGIQEYSKHETLKEFGLSEYEDWTDILTSDPLRDAGIGGFLGGMVLGGFGQVKTAYAKHTYKKEIQAMINNTAASSSKFNQFIQQESARRQELDAKMQASTDATEKATLKEQIQDIDSSLISAREAKNMNVVLTAMQQDFASGQDSDLAWHSVQAHSEGLITALEELHNGTKFKDLNPVLQTGLGAIGVNAQTDMATVSNLLDEHKNFHETSVKMRDFVLENSAKYHNDFQTISALWQAQEQVKHSKKSLLAARQSRAQAFDNATTGFSQSEKEYAQAVTRVQVLEEQLAGLAALTTPLAPGVKEHYERQLQTAQGHVQALETKYNFKATDDNTILSGGTRTLSEIRSRLDKAKNYKDLTRRTYIYNQRAESFTNIQRDIESRAGSKAFIESKAKIELDKYLQSLLKKKTPKHAHGKKRFLQTLETVRRKGYISDEVYNDYKKQANGFASAAQITAYKQQQAANRQQRVQKWRQKVRRKFKRQQQTPNSSGNTSNQQSSNTPSQQTPSSSNTSNQQTPSQQTPTQQSPNQQSPNQQTPSSPSQQSPTQQRPSSPTQQSPAQQSTNTNAPTSADVTGVIPTDDRVYELYDAMTEIVDLNPGHESIDTLVEVLQELLSPPDDVMLDIGRSAVEKFLTKNRDYRNADNIILGPSSNVFYDSDVDAGYVSYYVLTRSDEYGFSNTIFMEKIDVEIINARSATPKVKAKRADIVPPVVQSAAYNRLIESFETERGVPIDMGLRAVFGKKATAEFLDRVPDTVYHLIDIFKSEATGESNPNNLPTTPGTPAPLTPEQQQSTDDVKSEVASLFDSEPTALDAQIDDDGVIYVKGYDDATYVEAEKRPDGSTELTTVYKLTEDLNEQSSISYQKAVDELKKYLANKPKDPEAPSSTVQEQSTKLADNTQPKRTQEPTSIDVKEEVKNKQDFGPPSEEVAGIATQEQEAFLEKELIKLEKYFGPYTDIFTEFYNDGTFATLTLHVEQLPDGTFKGVPIVLVSQKNGKVNHIVSVTEHRPTIDLLREDLFTKDRLRMEVNDRKLNEAVDDALGRDSSDDTSFDHRSAETDVEVQSGYIYNQAEEFIAEGEFEELNELITTAINSDENLARQFDGEIDADVTHVSYLYNTDDGVDIYLTDGDQAYRIIFGEKGYIEQVVPTDDVSIDYIVTSHDRNVEARQAEQNQEDAATIEVSAESSIRELTLYAGDIFTSDDAVANGYVTQEFAKSLKTLLKLRSEQGIVTTPSDIINEIRASQKIDPLDLFNLLKQTWDTNAYPIDFESAYESLFKPEQVAANSQAARVQAMKDKIFLSDIPASMREEFLEEAKKLLPGELLGYVFKLESSIYFTVEVMSDTAVLEIDYTSMRILNSYYKGRGYDNYDKAVEVLMGEVDYVDAKAEVIPETIEEDEVRIIEENREVVEPEQGEEEVEEEVQQEEEIHEAPTETEIVQEAREAHDEEREVIEDTTPSQESASLTEAPTPVREETEESAPKADYSFKGAVAWHEKQLADTSDNTLKDKTTSLVNKFFSQDRKKNNTVYNLLKHLHTGSNIRVYVQDPSSTNGWEKGKIEFIVDGGQHLTVRAQDRALRAHLYMLHQKGLLDDFTVRVSSTPLAYKAGTVVRDVFKKGEEPQLYASTSVSANEYTSVDKKTKKVTTKEGRNVVNNSDVKQEGLVYIRRDAGTKTKMILLAKSLLPENVKSSLLNQFNNFFKVANNEEFKREYNAFLSQLYQVVSPSNHARYKKEYKQGDEFQSETYRTSENKYIPRIIRDTNGELLIGMPVVTGDNVQIFFLGLGHATDSNRAVTVYDGTGNVLYKHDTGKLVDFFAQDKMTSLMSMAMDNFELSYNIKGIQDNNGFIMYDESGKPKTDEKGNVEQVSPIDLILDNYTTTQFADTGEPVLVHGSYKDDLFMGRANKIEEAAATLDESTPTPELIQEEFALEEDTTEATTTQTVVEQEQEQTEASEATEVSEVTEEEQVNTDDEQFVEEHEATEEEQVLDELNEVVEEEAPQTSQEAQEEEQTQEEDESLSALDAFARTLEDSSDDMGSAPIAPSEPTQPTPPPVTTDTTLTSLFDELQNEDVRSKLPLFAKDVLTSLLDPSIKLSSNSMHDVFTKKLLAEKSSSIGIAGISQIEAADIINFVTHKIALELATNGLAKEGVVNLQQIIANELNPVLGNTVKVLGDFLTTIANNKSSLTDAQKASLGLLEETKRSLETISTNQQFIEEVKTKVKRLYGITINDDQVIDDDQITLERWQQASYTLDPKKNLGKYVNLYMSGVVSERVGAFGLTQFVSPKEVYDGVMGVINTAGGYNGTFEDLVRVLGNNTFKYKGVSEFANNLQVITDKQAKNAIATKLHKQNVIMRYVAKTMKGFRTRYINSHTMSEHVVVNWKRELFLGPLVETTETGIMHMIPATQKKIQKVIKTLEKELDKETLDNAAIEGNIRLLFKSLGLIVTDELIASILNGTMTTQTVDGQVREVDVKDIFNRNLTVFGDIKEGVSTGSLNEFFDHRRLTFLADNEVHNLTEAISPVFTFNGKKYYTVSDEHLLSNRISAILNNTDYRRKLLNHHSAKNSMWLKAVDKGVIDSKRFGYTAASPNAFNDTLHLNSAKDALALTQKEDELYNLVTFADSEIDQIYHEEIGGSISLRSTSIAIPTISDKGHRLSFSGLAYNFPFTANALKGQIFFNNDGSINDTGEVIFSQLIQTELDRIVEANKVGANSQRGTNLFLNYPFLNTLRDSSGQFYIQSLTNNPVIAYSAEYKQAIMDAMQNYFKERATTKTQEWDALGVFDDDGLPAHYEQQLARRANTKYHDDLKAYAALDYVLNYEIGQANISMILGLDPSNYISDKMLPSEIFGKNAAVFSENITLQNLNMLGKALNKERHKRLAAIVAPGTSTNRIGQKYNQVVVEDHVSIAGHAAYIAQTFYRQNPEIVNRAKELINEFSESPQKQEAIAKELAELMPEHKAYFELNSTDGQEFITLGEHLSILEAMGEISSAQHDALMEKYLNGEDYNAAELGVILKAMKPVYTNDILENGERKFVYIKSSSMVLLPQFTRGMELDVVRQAMEMFEKNSGNTVRLAFASAVKQGGRVDRKVKMFNMDGTLGQSANGERFTAESLANEFTHSYLTLPAEGLLIQQDVPVHMDNQFASPTQLNKLLFGGGLGNHRNKDAFNKAYSNLTTAHREKFLKRLGVDETGKVVNRNLFTHEIYNLIHEEAVARGWDTQTIRALKVKEFISNTFKGDVHSIPIDVLPSRTTIQDLIITAMNKSFIKYKVPGESYVVSTETGILGDGKGSNIVFTSKYDPSKGLQAERTDKDGYHPTQVFVSSTFRDASGKVIELVDKDGKPNPEYVEMVDGRMMLKKDSIDSSLLLSTMFRIPTSSHVSMSSAEIVGIITNANHSSIVVPAHLTAQMGMDYDVDKLYMFGKHTTTTKAGKIIVDSTNKVRKAESEYIDAINNTIHDPDNKVLRKNLLGTINLDVIERSAKLIENVKNSNDRRKYYSYNSDVVQKDNFNSAKTSSNAISSSSATVVLHSLLSQLSSPLSLTNPKGKPNVMVLGDFGLVELKFGGHNTLDGKRTIADALTEAQNNALDNAKNKFIDSLGWTEDLYNLDLLLNCFGIDTVDPRGDGNTIKFSALLFAHPTIQDILKTVDDKHSLLKQISEALPKGFKNSTSFDLLTGANLLKALTDSDTAQLVEREVLLFMQKMLTMQEPLMQLRKVLSFTKVGIGRSYSEQMSLQKFMKELFEENSINGEKVMFNPDKLLQISLVKDFRTALSSATNLLENISVGHNKQVQTVFEERIGDFGTGINTRHKDLLYDKFVTALMSYIASHPNSGLHNGNENMATELLNGSGSLANYLQGVSTNTELKSLFKQNPLLSSFGFYANRKTGNTEIIFSNAIHGDKEGLYESLQKLYLLNQELPDKNGKPYSTSELALDLIRYAMFKGYDASNTGFMRYVPTEMLSLLGFGDFFNQVLRDQKTLDLFLNDNFILQYARANADFVPGVSTVLIDVKPQPDGLYAINIVPQPKGAIVDWFMTGLPDDITKVQWFASGGKIYNRVRDNLFRAIDESSKANTPYDSSDVHINVGVSDGVYSIQPKRSTNTFSQETKASIVNEIANINKYSAEEADAITTIVEQDITEVTVAIDYIENFTDKVHELFAEQHGHNVGFVYTSEEQLTETGLKEMLGKYDRVVVINENDTASDSIHEIGEITKRQVEKLFVESYYDTEGVLPVIPDGLVEVKSFDDVQKEVYNNAGKIFDSGRNVVYRNSQKVADATTKTIREKRFGKDAKTLHIGEPIKLKDANGERLINLAGTHEIIQNAHGTTIIRVDGKLYTNNATMTEFDRIKVDGTFAFDYVITGSDTFGIDKVYMFDTDDVQAPNRTEVAEIISRTRGKAIFNDAFDTKAKVETDVVRVDAAVEHLISDNNIKAC